MMRHVKCILLLKWSTTFPRMWVLMKSAPYAQKDPRFLFEKRRWQPREFWSLDSTIDGSTLGETLKFTGRSPHIQQPAAASLYRKSYLENAAAFWLQLVVMDFDVSPYPRTVWKNSYTEHEITGKTYNNKKQGLTLSYNIFFCYSRCPAYCWYLAYRGQHCGRHGDHHHI